MDVESGSPCPWCGHRNRSDCRYCAQCGGRLGEVCVSCETLNETGERFCGHCGASLTGTAVEGECHQLTVLFCDLVGSTALAGQLDPEDWREVTAQYRRALADTVTRFGGQVAKYLGDGLLVYFGYPAAHEDDPERAVRAGLALITAVGDLNQQLGPARRLRLAVRVGMHTGPGGGGEGAAPGADVFGDTPNIAARVQALANPDAVLITEATHRLVAGLFIVEAKGALPLKGVGTPFEVYRVVQPSGVRSRLHAAGPGGLTPFVGREAERRLLRDRWAQATAGKGQVVLITGEPGIGKSRLVHMLKEALAGGPHSWIDCVGSPYHEHTPFHPFVEMLQQGLAGYGHETIAERVSALERSLGFAGLPLAETVPLITPLLGLEVPEHYAPLGLSAQAQRRWTFATLAAWVFGLARLQPCVLVVEDIHLMDPSTLELLGLLVEQGTTEPVLILCTARPEFRAPWPRLGHHAQLTLNRLTARQAREMVGHVAAGDALSEELLEALVARTDGVPLFVEELTRAVLETQPAGAGALAVPHTFQRSLMGRLDRLGAAKEVAQLGAVLGREFSYALLHDVSPLPQKELQGALEQLEEADLVYARGRPPEASYVYKHALVKDVAYQSLLKRTRQQLHARVVGVLEAELGVPVEPEVMARHAEAAGRIDESAVYYQRAGERAQECSAYEEAIAQFRKAIDLLGTMSPNPERDEREVSVQLVLGESLVAARGYAHAETEAALERARALSEAAGNTATFTSALLALSNVYVNRGEPDRSIMLAERVLAMSEDLQDQFLTFHAHNNAAVAMHYQGRFADSLAYCDLVIGLSDPGYDPAAAVQGRRTWYGTPRVVALGLAAWNLGCLGHADRALERAREGVALARTLAYPFDLAFALFFESVLHRTRQDPGSQRARAAEVIAIGDAQSFPLWRGVGRIYHGLARVMAGEGTAALAEVAEGMALAVGTGSRGGVPGLLYSLADGQRAAGQRAEALGTVENALAVADVTGQHFRDSSLHELKGELLLATEPANTAEAEALFRRALEIARAQEAKTYELCAGTSLARLWREQGRSAEARALLDPLYAWFTEGFGTPHLIEAKALLEELR